MVVVVVVVAVVVVAVVVVAVVVVAVVVVVVVVVGCYLLFLRKICCCYVEIKDKQTSIQLLSIYHTILGVYC